MSRVHIDQVRRSLAAIDAAPPKKVADALAKLAIARANARQLPRASAGDVAAAAAEALVDGRDPLDDESVRRLVVAQVLAGAGSGAEHAVGVALEKRVVTAMTDHADEIVALFKTAADAAGATLTDAHGILGGDDLAESGRMLASLGPAAATAWADAKAATARIGIIDSGWLALGELTGFARTSTPSTVRLADVGLDVHDRHRRSTVDPWTLVAEGCTIDLADATTAPRRIERLNAEREERDAAHAQAFTNEYRRLAGMGR